MHIFCIITIFCSQILPFISSGKALPPPIIDTGLADVVESVTVYSTVIYGDGSNDVRISSSLSGTSTHANFSAISKARIENCQTLISEVPLKITKWSSIFAKPCPHHFHGHRSVDRGIGLSHYQIWLEFMFFDHDLLEALTRPKPEYLNSTSYSSNSGTFRTVSNGTFLKNGIPFLENDILVVLEESAFLAAGANRVALKKMFTTELSAMASTDLVYLGWCNHNNTSGTASSRTGHNEHVKRGAKSHSHSHSHHSTSSAHTAPSSPHSQSCLYAYAITRRGARRLVRHYDMCASVSVEEQVATMSRYGWISTKRVSAESVRSVYTGSAGEGGGDVVISPILQQLRNETRSGGVFHQMKERI